jgi:hypothetical protein
LNILRNFVTVPLQFYTTAMQAWNATNAAAGLSSADGGVAMPDEMKTVVSAAHGEWRWKAPLWTVILWIGVSMTLILSSGAILFWILCLYPPDFEARWPPPLDIMSVSGLDCEIDDNRITLAKFASTRGAGSLISHFKGKNGYLIEAACRKHEINHVLFVVDPDLPRQGLTSTRPRL